ncbi:hypothetical protein [Butyrivibrio fibrisolvens]|uniref:hypothetical protein n=1 Tax=Butyrivibrio fibrisolvens TaxID=831 RepID=UPI0003B4B488|nr:hypothetical protein [Butyrivibrio fibrisolvens]
MYENNLVMNQNTRHNKTKENPINVSYFSTEYFALCFARVMVILLGLLFLTNLSVAGLKIRPYDDENEIYSDDEN